MRISDLLTLKWKHYQDGLIKKKKEKTKDTITIMVAEIDVTDEMIEERYKKATKGNTQLNPKAYIFDVIKNDLDKVAPDEKLNAISSATAIINKDLKKLAKNRKI